MTDLRAHTDEGPPQKRARREEDKEWWEEEAAEEKQEEDWEEVQQEDWENQESEEEGNNPFVEWGQPEPSQKVAELELDERMALLILAMKAILGCTALKWPIARTLIVGGMLLKDLRIGFCLCGIDELRRDDWILKTYGSMVTVQCGSGQWATSLGPPRP